MEKTAENVQKMIPVEILEFAIKAGIESGINAYEQQREKEQQKRKAEQKEKQDRKLRSTKLLLEHYRNFSSYNKKEVTATSLLFKYRLVGGTQPRADYHEGEGYEIGVFRHIAEDYKR